MYAGAFAAAADKHMHAQFSILHPKNFVWVVMYSLWLHLLYVQGQTPRQGIDPKFY